MAEKNKLGSYNYVANVKAEIQRRKIGVLMAVQLGIGLPLLFYLFARKNNFSFMTRQPLVPRELPDVFKQIDKEVDDCLMLYETRKEQNKAFAEIDGIENAEPIRMSESTAVFSYTGSDEERLRILEGKKLEKDKGSIIIKRVILKKENKPEEEDISLKVQSKYLMQTYTSYTSEYQNLEGKMLDILWLIMEPLEHKLSVREIDRNETIIRTIIRDVLHGLKYLHDNGIAHLDIKLANVMGEYLEEEKRIVYKLIDFGFSRNIPVNRKERYFRGRSYGTFPYKSPEVWNENIHGFSSDVWCLGAMSLFLANKETTYFQNKDAKKGTNNKDYAKFKAFVEGKHEVPVSDTASPELVDFIKKCMVRDRHKRWSVEMLLLHPFVTHQKLLPEEAKEVALNYYV
ncbi:hypothetical protein NECID01_1985 [Nematocida sp. AWRm77]|nr:hypothetical protein NECID01_1985 [Nematocida sp. AWRm77]